MRRDEAEKMASRRARLRPGEATRHDRRCGGGGDLRVEHVLLDSAATKNQSRCHGDAHDRGEGNGQRIGGGNEPWWPESEENGDGRTNSGDKIRRTGSVLDGAFRGE